MKKINYVLIYTLILLFSTCNKGSKSFEERLLDKIENCQEIDDCKVSIKEITNFKWDVMLVFKYNATFDDVKNAIGLEPDKYTEFTRKIIFTLKGNVVYFEELQTDVSGLNENEIIFDIPDSTTYNSYPVARSNFRVFRQDKEEGVYYFELQQLD